MHAFVLAGGFATRLWPLTEHRAKPLLPLLGKPILTHIVEKIPADIPVTVSTNAAFGPAFEAWKATIDRARLVVQIEPTKNDDEKLGALGALAEWIREREIDDDILLLTGDNWFGFDLNTFIAQYESGTALIAAHRLKNPALASAFGTVLMEEASPPEAPGDAQLSRRVTGFEEKPAQPKTDLVSTGCSILPRAAMPILLEFARLHPDNVGGIFEELLRKGERINAHIFSDPWFDIGSFDAYLEATKTLAGAGVLQAPQSVISDSKAEGTVIVGRGSRVEGSSLTNTVLFEDCVIEDCVLEDCILDDRCRLKGIDLRGKMLRAGTMMERR